MGERWEMGPGVAHETLRGRGWATRARCANDLLRIVLFALRAALRRPLARDHSRAPRGGVGDDPGRGAGSRLKGLSPVSRLSAAAVGSGLIYSAYLIFVAFLPNQLTKQRLSLFGALGRGEQALALYILASGTLFALAIVAWQAASAGSGWRVHAWALIPPTVFGFLLMLTMPLTSRDLF